MNVLPPPTPDTQRYELKESSGPHPWRKWRNRDGQLVPAVQWTRGIWDRQTRDWHTQPTAKSQSQFADVRKLNGMPPLTLQKVRGVLRRASITASATHTTRIPGWYHTTSGTTVWQSDDGAINVGYNFHHHAKERPYVKVLTPSLKALQDAGLNPTQHPDGRIEL